MDTKIERNDTGGIGKGVGLVSFPVGVSRKSQPTTGRSTGNDGSRVLQMTRATSKSEAGSGSPTGRGSFLRSRRTSTSVPSVLITSRLPRRFLSPSFPMYGRPV